MSIARQEVESIILEAVRVKCAAVLNGHTLANLDVKLLDLVSEQLAVTLTTQVLAEKAFEEPRVVSYPETWWDAFKERWFPLWAKCRWPVKWRHVTIAAKGFWGYPKLPSVHNDCGRPVQILHYKREERCECHA